MLKWKYILNTVNLPAGERSPDLEFTTMGELMAHVAADPELAGATSLLITALPVQGDPVPEGGMAAPGQGPGANPAADKADEALDEKEDEDEALDDEALDADDED